MPKPSLLAAATHPNVPATRVNHTLSDALAEYGRLLADNPAALPGPDMLDLLDRYSLAGTIPGAVAGTLVSVLGPRDVTRHGHELLASVADGDHDDALVTAAPAVAAGRGGKRLAAAWLRLLMAHMRATGVQADTFTLPDVQAAAADTAADTLYSGGLTAEHFARALHPNTAGGSATLGAVAAWQWANGNLPEDVIDMFAVAGIYAAGAGGAEKWLDACDFHGADQARLANLVAAGGHPDIDRLRRSLQRRRHSPTGPHTLLWAAELPGDPATDPLFVELLSAGKAPSAALYVEVARLCGRGFTADGACTWLNGYSGPDAHIAAGVAGVNVDHDGLRTAAADIISATSRRVLDAPLGGAAPYVTHPGADRWLATYPAGNINVLAWLLGASRPRLQRWLDGGFDANTASGELVAAAADINPNLTWTALSGWVGGETPHPLVAWLPGTTIALAHGEQYYPMPTAVRTYLVGLLVDAGGDSLVAWAAADEAAANNYRDYPSVAQLAAHMRALR